MTPVLVLMYHQIVPEGAPSGWVPAPLADPRYGVGQKDFVRQMGHLREEGYTILSLDSFFEPVGGETDPGRPAIVVTFDDGYASDFERATPALEHMRIPATFFIATGHLGAPGMMTESMVAEIVTDPIFRIGGHGESHRFLSDLPEGACRGELLRSLARIREITGQETVAMSAPGGRTDARVAEMARSVGFRALATSHPGLFPLTGGNLFSIPRLPVMGHHTLKDFVALLDPRSLTFRTDRWIRTAKQTARRIVRTLSPDKGG